uniref:Uncharacterized protein n=1 Tax=Podarcis muralis TaxID=64176 RepID=A0A670IMB3_PODMU
NGTDASEESSLTHIWIMVHNIKRRMGKVCLKWPGGHLSLSGQETPHNCSRYCGLQLSSSLTIGFAE